MHLAFKARLGVSGPNTHSHTPPGDYVKIGKWLFTIGKWLFTPPGDYAKIGKWFFTLFTSQAGNGYTSQFLLIKYTVYYIELKYS